MNNIKLIAFLEELKKQMILKDIYYRKAKFKCFGDGLFTYEYSNHSLLFEFTFICEDTLLSRMTIKELLELKGIKYFDNRVFDKKTMDVISKFSFE